MSNVKYLDWLDWMVFGGMLVLSSVIGVYFAFFSAKKQDTTNEYLMGSRSMGVFPISMSLIASYISGISILGIPAEIYVYGSQYYMVTISEVLCNITIVHFYLPVFFKLQLTSTYEYLYLRFGPAVRLFGTCLFLIKMMLYIPIVIYVPALAFSQVTGTNLHLITPIVCVVCIFYTSLGGLKAVVWADTFQMFLMLGGIGVVLFIGVSKVGGFETVFQRASESSRLEFLNTDVDLTTRHTLWSVVIGNYFYWLASMTVNQSMVQRCLSLSSMRQARWALFILAIGIFVILTLCSLTGFIIFAYFHDCDPIKSKKISKPDQLLPYFVMETSSVIPGLPGIFLSGVFSAALSTMSTGLNSMTGVIFKDIIQPIYGEMSSTATGLALKLVVVVIGALCVALVFIVEHLGTIVQATKSLLGITNGALIGVFSLGMFFPFTNSIGALAGGISSLVILAWISVGAQMEISRNRIVFPTKPVNVSGCSSLPPEPSIQSLLGLGDTEEVWYIFRLSYMWYSVIGIIIAMVVGLLVSLITKSPDHVDSDLLSPVVQRFWAKRRSEIKSLTDVNGVELKAAALKINTEADDYEKWL